MKSFPAQRDDKVLLCCRDALRLRNCGKVKFQANDFHFRRSLNVLRVAEARIPNLEIPMEKVTSTAAVSK